MDAPPSFTSVTARDTDHEQHPRPQPLTEPNHFEDQYNPSMSKIRSYSSFEDRTLVPTETYDEDGVQAVSIGAMAVYRAEVQIPDQITDTYYSNEQAPSMGVMVGGRGDSQPGGSYFSYNAPPSHSDVARHDDSRTGESTGGGQDLLEGNYEGISLTGRDFNRLYPTIFP
ncbi:hypothetical protein Hanom_Chr14g01273931 [Helianthus anomalus]